MTISSSARSRVLSVLGAIAIAIISNIVWEGLIRLVSLHFPRPHVEAIAILHFVGYMGSSLIGVFLGRELERQSIPIQRLRPKIQQSKVFVLEVSGSQPLDSPICDWKFFLTNCTNRVLRHVELYNVKSDLGTYMLGFHELPVIQPGEKVQLIHELWSRRMLDRDNGKSPTLWDFATDITGQGRSSFIWYKILIEYKEAEDDDVHSGDFVFVCFDLPEKKMKTEGAQHVLGNRSEYSGWEP
jgi:hypothetical protein